MGKKNQQHLDGVLSDLRWHNVCVKLNSYASLGMHVLHKVRHTDYEQEWFPSPWPGIASLSVHMFLCKGAREWPHWTAVRMDEGSFHCTCAAGVMLSRCQQSSPLSFQSHLHAKCVHICMGLAFALAGPLLREPREDSRTRSSSSRALGDSLQPRLGGGLRHLD